MLIIAHVFVPLERVFFCTVALHRFLLLTSRWKIFAISYHRRIPMTQSIRMRLIDFFNSVSIGRLARVQGYLNTFHQAILYSCACRSLMKLVIKHMER